MITTDLASEADRLAAAHRRGDRNASELLRRLIAQWYRDDHAGLIRELTDRMCAK